MFINVSVIEHIYSKNTAQWEKVPVLVLASAVQQEQQILCSLHLKIPGWS